MNSHRNQIVAIVLSLLWMGAVARSQGQRPLQVGTGLVQEAGDLVDVLGDVPRPLIEQVSDLQAECAPEGLQDASCALLQVNVDLGRISPTGPIFDLNQLVK